IVALCAEVTDEPMRTFSMDFGDASFSETQLARMVARRYNTIHREKTVEMRPLDILPKLAHLLDEPFADSSVIPTFYVAQMAREDVTVALGGDGGDELFAGYHTYTAGKLNRLYTMLPRFISKGLLPRLVNFLPVSHRKDSWDFKAKKFVNGAIDDPARAHFMWKVIFDEEQKARLCPLARSAREESFDAMRRYFDRYAAMDHLRQWQYTDTKVYLPDDILTKVDRMTMGNSLEARVPFLDHEFAEVVMRMPSRMKMKFFSKKYILKRAMEGRLPREILHGRKQGFSVPMAQWLRGELQPAVREYLRPTAIRNQGIFDETYVTRMIQAHNSMSVDYSRNIWGLLTFMLWHEEYGRAPRRPARPAVREREQIAETT
ncbi:MAG: asparagine synthetase B, partial [Planctomycetes bacterium]|nr:asparagine synthetase B [Planctomycetota bacterium]